MPEAARDTTGTFILRWIVLCGLGLGSGLFVGLSLSVPVEAVVGMMLVTPVILAIAGSLFGALQWLAIWKDCRTGVLWVAGSAIGLGVGMTLGIVLVEAIGRTVTGDQVRLISLGPLGQILGLTLVGTISGLSVGTAQWFGLRSLVSVGGRWVLGCTAGFGIGMPFGALAAELLLGGLQNTIGFVGFLGFTGLAIGLLTVRGAARIVTDLPVHRNGGIRA